MRPCLTKQNLGAGEIAYHLRVPNAQSMKPSSGPSAHKEAEFPRGTCPGGESEPELPTGVARRKQGLAASVPKQRPGDLNECPCHLAWPVTHRRLCRWLQVMYSELKRSQSGVLAQSVQDCILEAY